MSTAPRMPYGVARRVVAGLRPGEEIYVRPQYVVQFHNAARRLELTLRAWLVRRKGRKIYCMSLRTEGQTSGHAKNFPRRNRRTGRWLPAKTRLLQK